MWDEYVDEVNEDCEGIVRRCHGARGHGFIAPELKGERGQNPKRTAEELVEDPASRRRKRMGDPKRREREVSPGVTEKRKGNQWLAEEGRRKDAELMIEDSEATTELMDGQSVGDPDPKRMREERTRAPRLEEECVQGPKHTVEERVGDRMLTDMQRVGGQKSEERGEISESAEECVWHPMQTDVERVRDAKQTVKHCGEARRLFVQTPWRREVNVWGLVRTKARSAPSTLRRGAGYLESWMAPAPLTPQDASWWRSGARGAGLDW